MDARRLYKITLSEPVAAVLGHIPMALGLALTLIFVLPAMIWRALASGWQSAIHLSDFSAYCARTDPATRERDRREREKAEQAQRAYATAMARIGIGVEPEPELEDEHGPEIEQPRPSQDRTKTSKRKPN